MAYSKKRPEIYVDFDGTITSADIGDELFREFGRLQPYNSQLRRNEISIEEYWKLLFSTLSPELTRKDVEEYAVNCEIDPYFVRFANFCRSRKLKLSVVSDGFDAYIEPVLYKEKLAWLPVYCNKMIFTENGPPVPVYPYASESCSCPCASCKRNSVLANTGPDCITVFIGDGFSDFCAAEHSDIVFAKKNLAAYCNEHRIPHYPFHTFFDVQRIMENILNRGGLRKRHQAELKRKKAFETE